MVCDLVTGLSAPLELSTGASLEVGAGLGVVGIPSMPSSSFIASINAVVVPWNRLDALESQIASLNC